ncbi:MAG: family 1 glycosylhydrolase [Candidatus Moranbacteria bacterium]|jgi:beta-glucosidase|nr:family 1 glycosylhydrolase [Candidatus Moranbacteria bacterium]
MSTLKFPDGFLWGAATASHQVEGNTHNDWSEWEHANAERLARESEKTFAWNPHWGKFRAEATNPQNYISGTACDHYTRFREDFDLAQSLHHNTHRLSIEWSRIEPEEGTFDDAAIDHYRQVILALRERGLEPFVTLWHWTFPLWLSQKGGIVAKDFPKYFERYTAKLVEALGEQVQFWITLNEPDVVSSHAYLKGTWPPQKKNPFLLLRSWYVLKRAHQKAYRVIKQHAPQAQVGIAKHQVYFELAEDTFVNRLLKSVADWLWNRYFLNLISDTQDFIGLNHYNRNMISNGFNKNPNLIQTDFGWDYTPDSLYNALIELKPYNKPIYITENGLADAADTLRQQFIPEALTAMHRALTAGIDVRGYFYWSLLDNFEWDKGFWPRFGLIAVDRATQARTVRPSAHAYAQVCQTNTLEIE